MNAQDASLLKKYNRFAHYAYSLHTDDLICEAPHSSDDSQNLIHIEKSLYEDAFLAFVFKVFTDEASNPYVIKTLENARRGVALDMRIAFNRANAARPRYAHIPDNEMINIKGIETFRILECAHDLMRTLHNPKIGSPQERAAAARILIESGFTPRAPTTRVFHAPTDLYAIAGLPRPDQP